MQNSICSAVEKKEKPVNNMVKCKYNADLVSRDKHMDEPTPSGNDTITQEERYPLPWSMVNNHSE